MTETEKARMNEARDQASAFFEALMAGGATVTTEDGQEASASEANALMAQVVGLPLAMMDALFAIRDGEPWRGISDPQEIASKTLREVGAADKN